MHNISDIPRERLIEIFGYATPVKRELDAYSDMIWRNSIHYRRDIKRSIVPSRVHGFMRELGYYQILDFQIRQGQIRFTEEGILGVAVVSGLDELLAHPTDPFYWV